MPPRQRPQAPPWASAYSATAAAKPFLCGPPRPRSVPRYRPAPRPRRSSRALPRNLSAVPPVPHRPTPRRNRLVAVVVLGTMLLMATLSLTFALYTRAERRANDTAMKKRPGRGLFAAARPEPPPEPLSPWRLPLLGYLPPDTNIVLGLHVAELLHDKAGRQLLDQPLRLGRSSIRPGQIAGWCGLPLEDIDHIVLGISTGDPLIPPAVLLVRTNRPYLPEQVRNCRQGRAQTGKRQETTVSFQSAKPDGGRGRVVYRRADPGPGADPCLPGCGPGRAACRAGSSAPNRSRHAEGSR